MQQTIRITVTGKVQGVFFRQSTKEKAIALGITGFVQNMPDDTVFITATGEKEQLDALVSWCHTGPPRAKVTHVDSAIITSRSFDDFQIKRSSGD